MTERERLQVWLEDTKRSKLPHFAAARLQYAYTGIEDFLLQHGKWYEHAPLDTHQYRPRQKISCIENALLTSIQHGLPYVEGVTCLRGFPVTGLFHAWNLGPDGRVVDTTWVGPEWPTERAYIGVEFSIGRAEDAVFFKSVGVLDNYIDRYALFREQWTGEDFTRKWKKGPLWEHAQCATLT